MANNKISFKKANVSVSVSGQATIVKNLSRFTKRQADKVSRGLKLAGLFIQRESQLIVPIDTGVLRNSAFTRARGFGFKTAVGVGYTTDYAIYVHEDLSARHAPGKVAKYLEIPVRTKQKEILMIVQRAAK